MSSRGSYQRRYNSAKHAGGKTKMQTTNIKNQTNSRTVQGETKTMTNKKHESLLRPKAGALSVKISKQSGTPLFAEKPSIRTELPAHTINQNNNLDINTLLKVKK
jgi:hypothetical protein